jgi:hypothetical protein
LLFYFVGWILLTQFLLSTEFCVGVFGLAKEFPGDASQDTRQAIADCILVTHYPGGKSLANDRSFPIGACLWAGFVYFFKSIDDLSEFDQIGLIIDLTSCDCYL